MRTWVVALLAALGLLCLPLLLLTPRTAHAQVLGPAPDCLPDRRAGDWLGGRLYTGASAAGTWAYWYCFRVGGDVNDPPLVRRVLYVGTWADQPRVGARLQTIKGAADPLASLRALPSRITMLPLTDPALAPIVVDALAHEAAMLRGQ